MLTHMMSTLSGLQQTEQSQHLSVAIETSPPKMSESLPCILDFSEDPNGHKDNCTDGTRIIDVKSLSTLSLPFVSPRDNHRKVYPFVIWNIFLDLPKQ